MEYFGHNLCNVLAFLYVVLLSEAAMSFRLGLKISTFVARNLNPILDGEEGG